MTTHDRHTDRGGVCYRSRNHWTSSITGSTTNITTAITATAANSTSPTKMTASTLTTVDPHCTTRRYPTPPARPRATR